MRIRFHLCTLEFERKIKLIKMYTNECSSQRKQYTNAVLVSLTRLKFKLFLFTFTAEALLQSYSQFVLETDSRLSESHRMKCLHLIIWRCLQQGSSCYSIFTFMWGSSKQLTNKEAHRISLRECKLEGSFFFAAAAAANYLDQSSEIFARFDSVSKQIIWAIDDGLASILG